MWPICEIGGVVLVSPYTEVEVVSVLMSLLSVKKVRRDILRELSLVPLEWLP